MDNSMSLGLIIILIIALAGGFSGRFGGFGRCTLRVLPLSGGRSHEPSFERDGFCRCPGDCRASLGADADDPQSGWCAVHDDGRAIYPIRTARDIPNCTLRAAGSHAADGTISHGSGPILNDRERDRTDAPGAPQALRGAYAHASDAPCSLG